MDSEDARHSLTSKGAFSSSVLGRPPPQNPACCANKTMEPVVRINPIDTPAMPTNDTPGSSYPIVAAQVAFESEL